MGTFNDHVAALDGDGGVTDKLGALASAAAEGTLGGGTFSKRVIQTLTSKTSWAGFGAEQWGTEEATVDDALLPGLTNVTVYATVRGHVFGSTSDGSVTYRVDISLDGGSTWSEGTANFWRADPSTANDRYLIFADHLVEGTVTGDIQAKCMALSSTGAADTADMLSGVIAMEVLQQS